MGMNAHTQLDNYISRLDYLVFITLIIKRLPARPGHYVYANIILFGELSASVLCIHVCWLLFAFWERAVRKLF